MYTKKERIELHCHSCYSENDGVSTIEDLIDASVEQGVCGLAITDYASVSGFREAMEYSRQFADFKMIYGMEGFVVDDLNGKNTGDIDYIKSAQSFHTSFLIKNEIGKQNLFKLITKSNILYKTNRARIPWSEIEKHKEGLLIGSACAEGQLYYLLTHGATEEKLKSVAKRFDYLELQPADSKLFLIRDTTDYDIAIARIQEIDRKIVELGDKLGIPVVATGDVHFATSKERQAWSIIQDYLGNEFYNQHGLQIRNTNKMLESFSYLDKDKAYEIVVENTHRIATQIEHFDIMPLEKRKYYPKIDNASERLYNICICKLKEMYGENINKSVLSILNWELEGLRKSKSDSIMLIAKELIDESELNPFEFGCIGSPGGLLSAYLCGITCVNPLETKLPLYPEFEIGINGDNDLDIDLIFPMGFRDKIQEICANLEGICDFFSAGKTVTMSFEKANLVIEEYEERYDIEFTDENKELLLREIGNVVVGRDEWTSQILLVPEGYEISEFAPLDNLTQKISPINYSDLRGYLYGLGISANDDVTMIYRLMKITGINVDNISLDDINVAKMFSGRTILNTKIKEGTDAIGVPRFRKRFTNELAKGIGVDSFADILKIISFSYGTGFWQENAEISLKKEGITKERILSSAEDIFEFLKILGFNRKKAFGIARFVSMGNALLGHFMWDTWKQEILDAGAPEWFIWSCERIFGLSPRAYNYRDGLYVWWCAWFKLYYPNEFYKVYFETYTNRDFIEIVKNGPEALDIYKQGYYDGISEKSFCTKESFYIKESFYLTETNFLLAEEMYERGIKFD